MLAWSHLTNTATQVMEKHACSTVALPTVGLGLLRGGVRSKGASEMVTDAFVRYSNPVSCTHNMGWGREVAPWPLMVPVVYLQSNGEVGLSQWGVSFHLSSLAVARLAAVFPHKRRLPCCHTRTDLGPVLLLPPHLSKIIFLPCRLGKCS